MSIFNDSSVDRGYTFTDNIDPLKSNDYIIKPPENREKAEIGRKPFELIVNSADRNYSKYPYPNNYEVQLKEDLKDVVSAELIYSDIPRGQYQIDTHNNLLHFSETIVNKNNLETEKKIIEIDPGDYIDLINGENEKDLLADTIEKELNKQGESNYTVNYLARLDKYILSSDLSSKNDDINRFKLHFEGNKVPYGPQSIDKVIKRNIDGNIIRDDNGDALYEEVKVGDSDIQYIDRSIGNILGFNKENYDGKLKGTVSVQEDTPDILVCTDNVFKDILEGHWLGVVKPDESKSYRLKIEKVIDGRTIQFSSPINVEGIEEWNVFSGVHIAPSRREKLNERDYVILKIPAFHRIESYNSAIEKSFSFLSLPMTMTESLAVRQIKYFNPPLPRLSEIKVEFLNLNGDKYNFNGKEHILYFSINTLRQSHKYASQSF